MSTETVSSRGGIGRARGLVDVDPIATEVIRNGLDAAADQMRIVLQRTAFSPVIYEITDFAAALYDKQYRLLAQARALPLFLGTLSFCVESAVTRLGGDEVLEPGDVLFTSYGYDVGSHPQDAAVIVPSFFEGELVAYAAIKAHHLDIGAKSFYCTDSTDVFQEGTIFPGVRIYRAGVLQDDLYRTMLANSRLPQALAGDLAAQIAAAKTGLNELSRLIERYGLRRFQQHVEAMFDHSEALMRSFFASLPDGRYVQQGAMDSNGITDDLVPFEVAVEVSGDDVVVDFTASPPEQVGPINCPLPSTVSAARLAVMSLAGAHTEGSANEGSFRPIEIRTRPGTMFHPLPPAPLYLGTWPAMASVEVIFHAFSEVLPDDVPAASGGDICGVLWAGNDSNGNYFIDAADHCVGQGASSGGDGGAPLMYISCSGIRSRPVELIESRGRMLVEKFEYAPDSGGAGTFRGGLGLDIHYRTLCDLMLVIPWERTKTLPWGLHGGASARANRFRVCYPDGTTTEYTKVTDLPVPAGSLLEIHTGGGGGYGPPSGRDPAAVHQDIAEGYVTEEAMRRAYPAAFGQG